MRSKDLFRLTWLQYKTNRTRNVLCCSAVTVGVIAMLLLVHIGSFAADQVTGMVDSLGLRGMTVYIEKSTSGETMTAAFAEYMETEIPDIKVATPVKFAAGTYKSGHKSGNVALIGCEEDISKALGIDLLYGRNIPGKKIVDVQNPLVISKHFAQELYQRDNVVGKELYVTISGKQERFTVVGVLEDQVGLFNSILGGYIPELAYVSLDKLTPSNTADQILFSTDQETDIIQPVLQGAAQMAFGMRSTLGVQNISGYEQQINALTDKMEWILLAFSGFSMIVAAFAIENSMMSAMQEMREELMLYRMIGFRRVDILRFFLMQSILICLIGAVIGSLISWALITAFRVCFVSAFPFDAQHLLTVLAVVVPLGGAAGIFPALQILSKIKNELYD